jgi:hypothetical protein
MLGRVSPSFSLHASSSEEEEEEEEDDDDGDVFFFSFAERVAWTVGFAARRRTRGAPRLAEQPVVHARVALALALREALLRLRSRGRGRGRFV